MYKISEAIYVLKRGRSACLCAPSYSLPSLLGFRRCIWADFFWKEYGLGSLTLEIEKNKKKKYCFYKNWAINSRLTSWLFITLQRSWATKTVFFLRSHVDTDYGISSAPCFGELWQACLTLAAHLSIKMSIKMTLLAKQVVAITCGCKLGDQCQAKLRNATSPTPSADMSAD